MRRPKYPHLRLLAMLAIMVSAFGVFGAPASAAPADTGADGAALYQATGTVTVTKYVCAGLETVVWGGTPDANCEPGTGAFDFYLIGDGTAEYWTLNVTGTGTITLAAGSYEVWEQGVWAKGAVTVTAGADTALTVLNPGGSLPTAVPTVLPTVMPTEPPAEPETGGVELWKYYCAGVETARFLDPGEVVPDGCVPGPATFTFYLVGDGTADYWQVDVWEDGFGYIQLPVGTYEVIEEGTGLKTTVVVEANVAEWIRVVNPGEAPTPRDGTVNLSKFYCTNITDVIFSSNSFVMTMVAGDLPTFEPACQPGEATFTFYLVGDGTADYEQITIDGTGSISLPPGVYEVVEEGTLASAFITVIPGEFITLDVQNPTGEYEPGASVNVVKFYCDTVTETEFIAYDEFDYSDREQLPTAPDCVSGPATFTFYLVGDGTADYAQLKVDGSGTIGLEPGTYEVVEEETQAKFTLEVLADENTLLVVNNPMPDDGEVPTPVPTTPATSKVTPAAGDVTKLPSTGSGMDEGATALALAAVAASAIAGAGVLIVNRKR